MYWLRIDRQHSMELIVLVDCCFGKRGSCWVFRVYIMGGKQDVTKVAKGAIALTQSKEHTVEKVTDRLCARQCSQTCV